MSERPQTHGQPHPGPKQYIAIASVLTAITIVEVAVYYIEALKPALVPILLLLSSVKFALVVMFYMHLKFDHGLFSALFVGGLVLAISVVVALMALFQAFLR
ncbi:MAG: cytochrome C oxidase subunit IV [Dehalococcoidia bacterium]|nr:cytochrome C oxidase subunit IV [Dehalococcoidia bacterium]